MTCMWPCACVCGFAVYVYVCSCLPPHMCVSMPYVLLQRKEEPLEPTAERLQQIILTWPGCYPAICTHAHAHAQCFPAGCPDEVWWPWTRPALLLHSMVCFSSKICWGRWSGGEEVGLGMAAPSRTRKLGLLVHLSVSVCKPLSLPLVLIAASHAKMSDAKCSVLIGFAQIP